MKLVSRKNVLYCRVGWMEYYNLEMCPFEKILKGGSFPNHSKFEVYNFQNLYGDYYGFVQVQKSKSIKIAKLNAKNNDYAENVLVIWVANNPQNNKNVIVGIYDNAKVWRKYNAMGAALMMHREERKSNIFNISTNKAYLLPNKERNIEINKAILGQNQFSYGTPLVNKAIIKKLRNLKTY